MTLVVNLLVCLLLIIVPLAPLGEGEDPLASCFVNIDNWDRVEVDKMGKITHYFGTDMEHFYELEGHRLEEGIMDGPSTIFNGVPWVDYDMTEPYAIITVHGQFMPLNRVIVFWVQYLHSYFFVFTSVNPDMRGNYNRLTPTCFFVSDEMIINTLDV